MSDPTQEQQPAAAPQPTPVPPTPEVASEVKPVEPQKLTITQPTSMAEDLGNIVTELGFDLGEVDSYMDTHGALPEKVKQELVSKYGEAAAKMILAQIDAQGTEHAAAAAAEDKAMFSHLSEAFEGITDQDGEQTWKELKDWAGKNLTEEKDEINSMLSQGGFIAKQALTHLVNKFKESNDFTQSAKLQNGEGLNNEHAIGALDKAGYDRELRELTSKGYDYSSQEVQRLQARRLKSIKRGQ